MRAKAAQHHWRGRRLLCLFLFICYFALPQAYATDWIIDTDMGVDDVLALLFMLKHPDVNVKAITIEGDGIAHCDPAFAHVKALLTLTHHANLPIACGRSTPLQGTHHFPAALLKNADTLAGMANTQPAAIAPREAKKLLINLLQNATQPMNILAIGPLTTLAEVLDEQPRIKANIQRIYIMGGAIAVPGNIHEVDPSQANRVAEWNIYLDPHAAEKVFQSGIKIVLIPLDVTNQVSLDKDFYEALRQRQNTPVATYAIELLTRNKTMIENHQWYFWDPLAAAIGSDETLADCKILPIRIVLKPEALSGTTLIDKKNGHAIDVCTTVNKARFKKDFLLRLTS